MITLFIIIIISVVFIKDLRFEKIPNIFNSPNEKPIGSSSDKRVDNTKLYINIFLIFMNTPFSLI